MKAHDSTTAIPTLPGLVGGSWTIDAAHSDVSFIVRHLMVSKVRGKFTRSEGVILCRPEGSDVFLPVVDVSKISSHEMEDAA